MSKLPLVQPEVTRDQAIMHNALPWTGSRREKTTIDNLQTQDRFPRSISDGNLKGEKKSHVHITHASVSPNKENSSALVPALPLTESGDSRTVLANHRG